MSTRAVHTRSSLIACLALALAAFMALPTSAHAVPATELLARSRTAASRGDWNAASRSLEELVAAGIDSSDVLYDLGTAYAQAGRYGEAIYRLETVVRRSPFAFDAQQNLRAARLRLAHRDAARTGRAVVEAAPPFWTSVAELLPLDWAVVLCVSCELLAIAALLFLRRRRGGEFARVGAAAGIVLFTLAALAFGTIVAARHAVPPAGIVLRDGLRLLRTANADAIPEASVREGERVDVLAREGVFVRVRTGAGASGWLSSRDLGRLAE